MGIIDKFRRRHKTELTDDVISQMKDEGLSYTDQYEVADVIFSAEGAHRFVILKAEKGFYTYRYEVLLNETGYDGSPYWYWLERDLGPVPVFDDMEILMRELKAEPSYKAHFIKEE